MECLLTIYLIKYQDYNDRFKANKDIVVSGSYVYNNWLLSGNYKDLFLYSSNL